MATDYTLLSAAAATGSAVANNRGYYDFTVYGTWDGATAQMQKSPDGGTTWIDISGGAFLADGSLLDVPLGAGHVRVEISGAGGSTSITALLRGIR